MTPPQSDPRVARGCHALLRLGATEVYLFGSAARGTAGPTSDLDFAVKGIQESDLFRALADLTDAVQGPADLTLLDSDTAFAQHIQDKIERGWAIRVG